MCGDSYKSSKCKGEAFSSNICPKGFTKTSCIDGEFDPGVELTLLTIHKNVKWLLDTSIM